MKIYFNILLITVFSTYLVSCSTSKKKVKSTTLNMNESKNKTELENTQLFNEDKELFYTVEPKLEDIESEIALLKEKVIQLRDCQN